MRGIIVHRGARVHGLCTGCAPLSVQEVVTGVLLVTCRRGAAAPFRVAQASGRFSRARRLNLRVRMNSWTRKPVAADAMKPAMAIST